MESPEAKVDHDRVLKYFKLYLLDLFLFLLRVFLRGLALHYPYHTSSQRRSPPIPIYSTLMPADAQPPTVKRKSSSHISGTFPFPLQILVILT